MPELRTDWLTGRRVIIAENRADRPNEFGPSGKHAIAENAPAAALVARGGLALASSNCPFCPGHEGETPPTVYERHDDAGRWCIRVISNKYPAVTPPAGGSALKPVAGWLEQSAGAATDSPSTSALSQPTNRALHVAPAIGAHEVIIESARHVTRTTALARSELHDVLQTYVERLRHWQADDQLRYSLLFKNQGPDAGASLSHLHSQLLVIPEIPSSVAAELRRAEEAYRHDRLCPYCRWIVEERQAEERIILDSEGFVAFCPAAGMQPLEFWLFPTEHQSAFERIDSSGLKRLAGVLHTLLSRLELLLPEASYNMLLRTAPWLPGLDAWCHWRIEVLPRVASFAGLELGTGIYINPLSPEHAAARLRDAK